MADEGEFLLEPAKDLRVGRYVLVDGVPCRVLEIETSSPGKHGAAKMRITAMGIFDGGKKTLLASAHADVQVPVIKKRKGSIVSFSETTVQVMDAETYETYDLPIPEEFKGKLEAGKEVEVMETMGRKALSRVY
ncbi:MAG: translation initiation factor IF-5A [Candidatus Micrarchaeales archaeon]|nr:translation initiation factor IF-5A [Candidatus Micrarchaeales archaeon]